MTTNTETNSPRTSMSTWFGGSVACQSGSKACFAREWSLCSTVLRKHSRKTTGPGNTSPPRERIIVFVFFAAKLRCMSEIWHHRHQQRLSLTVPPRLNPISEKKKSKCTPRKKNTHRTVEECHVTKDLLLDGIRKRKCMSKIWRPKTSHKDEALNKNCKTRNMPKKRTLKISAVQSLKCPTVR